MIDGNILQAPQRSFYLNGRVTVKLSFKICIRPLKMDMFSFLF